MKRNRTVWAVVAIVAIAAGLYFTGCEQPTSEPDETPPVVIVDKPAEGVMTKATADKVFTWKAEGAGAVIEKFLDAGALQGYLAGSRQVTGTAGATLVIKEIDGKAVTRIAGNAFKPATKGGKDDITTVVTVVKLPVTIETLGAKLFEGVSKPVQVDIPQTAPVIAKIVEAKVEAAKGALDAGASEAEIAAAVAGALAEAAAEVTKTLQAAAGAEAGIAVAASPSVPSDPAVPVLPPVVIVTKPETVPQPGTDEPGTQPGTDEPGTQPGTDEPGTGSSVAVATYYGVQYNGNGATAGTAPVDGTPYPSSSSVTVKANTFVREGYVFQNWTTESDGGGEDYTAGETFIIHGDTTLYAQWLQTVNVTEITGIAGPNEEEDSTPALGAITGTGFTGTVVWSAWNPDSSTFEGVNPEFTSFDAGTLYKATITLTAAIGYTFSGVPADSFTVAGAIATNPANSGVITAVFSGIRADDEASLDNAVIAAKEYNKTGEPKGGATIYLSEDFYGEEFETYITIDGGTADNSIPYTIKGLGGRDGADDAPELSVGILLANNNVTLDGVKFVMETYAKGAPVNMQSYKAAVSIRRLQTASTPTDNPSPPSYTDLEIVSSDVTVKDCYISFISTSQVSGIFISGPSATSTGRNTPKNIKIIHNEISVNSTNGAATQAIGIRRYDPSIEITDNILTSTNTVSSGTGHWNVPAGAIFIQIDPDNIPNDNIEPKISGNTLHGVFDFYVNIYPVGNFTGIPALFNSRFGTKDTTWVTVSTEDTDPTFYKKLFDKLLLQVKNDNGFGFFQMLFGANDSIDEKIAAREQYDINGGKVTAIDFWGPKAYTDEVYTIEGNNIGNNTGGARDRIIVDPDTGEPDSSEEVIGDQFFHWYKEQVTATEGTDF